jgi:hypothetical protein
MACPDAVTSIQNTIDAYMASAQLKRLINENARERNPTNASGFDIDDVEAAYTNNIASAFNSSAVTVPGAVQGAGQFMKNALFYATVTDTFKCMDSAGSQSDYNLCNITLNQGMEPWKADATAQGSMFAKMALPAMIFLQLMFFGFAPLVILYSFFLGAGSVGLYVKFLGFGVWTMSWLPFSAVIQMYIQNNVTDKLAALQTKAVTAGNYEAFMYDVLSTRLALASDLLAATPMVTLALLSGSIYGMSSLAGRWSGRDYMDEKNVAPPHVKTDAEVAIGPGVTAAMRGGNVQSTQLAGLNEGISISTGQLFNTALSNAKAQMKTATQTATHEFGKTLSSAINSGSSEKDLYQFAQSTGITNTETAKQARTDAYNWGLKAGMSSEQADQLARKAELMVGASAGGSIGLNLGSLAKLNVGGQAGTQNSAGEIAQLTEKMTRGLEHVKSRMSSYSVDDSVMRSIATNETTGKAMEKLHSSTFGESNTASWKQSVQEANAAQSRFEALSSRSSSLQISSNTTSLELSDAIRNNRNEITRKAADGVSALRAEIGDQEVNKLMAQAEKSVAAFKSEAGLVEGDQKHAQNIHTMVLASKAFPDAKANDKLLDVLEAANPINMSAGRGQPLAAPDMKLEARAARVGAEVEARAGDGERKALAAQPIVDKVNVGEPNAPLPRAGSNPAVSDGAFERGAGRLEGKHNTETARLQGDHKAAEQRYRQDNPALPVRGMTAADMVKDNEMKRQPDYQSGVTDPLGLTPTPIKMEAPGGGTAPSGTRPGDGQPVLPRSMGNDAPVREAIANSLAPDDRGYAQPITMGSAAQNGPENAIGRSAGQTPSGPTQSANPSPSGPPGEGPQGQQARANHSVRPPSRN